MKTISFSDVRFVKAILEGKKTQTITRNGYGARLKVGDYVKLYFKQRSSPAGSWFCQGCGKILDTTEHECTATGKIESMFVKHFANARITEAFEIKMSQDEVRFLGGKLINLDELMKRDGFKSWLDGSQWFHKRYNLKEPKRFAVYRFEVAE